MTIVEVRKAVMTPTTKVSLMNACLWRATQRTFANLQQTNSLCKVHQKKVVSPVTHRINFDINQLSVLFFV
jgi:hypothetical protein